ncbi:MAG: type II secretion system protein [Methylophilaceae bacterium]
MALIMRIGELKQSGYALLAMLVLIIIIGFTLAEAGALWSDARRRDREQELLKIGDKFRIAIGQYYNNTPGPIKQYPPTLQALLRDDRYPIPQRYLRVIYIDPLTGRQNWGMLMSVENTIVGVYSLSGDKPFKLKQFRYINKDFESKKTYSDWTFAYLPQVHDTSPAN